MYVFYSTGERDGERGPDENQRVRPLEPLLDAVEVVEAVTVVVFVEEQRHRRSGLATVRAPVQRRRWWWVDAAAKMLNGRFDN